MPKSPSLDTKGSIVTAPDGTSVGQQFSVPVGDDEQATGGISTNPSNGSPNVTVGVANKKSGVSLSSNGNRTTLSVGDVYVARDHDKRETCAGMNHTVDLPPPPSNPKSADENTIEPVRPSTESGNPSASDQFTQKVGEVCISDETIGTGAAAVGGLLLMRRAMKSPPLQPIPLPANQILLTTPQGPVVAPTM